MAISDRIAVMDGGIIQQIGSPKELYQRPANKFVATFIGRTNIISAKAFAEDGKCGIQFASGSREAMDNLSGVNAGDDIVVSVRPEEFIIDDGKSGLNPCINATVVYSTFLGLNTHYIVESEEGQRLEIIQESQIEDILEKGTRIKLALKKEKINVFTADGSQSLVK